MMKPEVPQNRLDEECQILHTVVRQVIEEELERIKLLALAENDRVMSLLMRKNDAVDACPSICLEDFFAISKDDERPIIAMCCGTGYHWS